MPLHCFYEHTVVAPFIVALQNRSVSASLCRAEELLTQHVFVPRRIRSTDAANVASVRSVDRGMCFKAVRACQMAIRASIRVDRHGKANVALHDFKHFL